MTLHKAKGLQFPVVIMPFLDWEQGPKPNGGDLLWVHTDKQPYFNYTPLPVNMSSSLAETYFAGDYNEEVTLSCLDNLNLLYVAFTRPEERLYVFAPAADTARSNSIASLSLEVLLQLNKAHDASTDNFEFGKKEKPMVQEDGGKTKKSDRSLIPTSLVL